MTTTVDVEAELRERLEQDDNGNLPKYLTRKQDDQKADTLADSKYDTRSKSERNNLINTKRYSYASTMADLFHRAFYDEGHRIKSPKTRTHRVIVATRSKFHWIISTTPMMNRVSNLIGYLHFFWRVSWKKILLKQRPCPEITSAIYGESFWNDSVEQAYKDEFNNNPLYRLDPTFFATLANRLMNKENFSSTS